jgi:hypothetical protein
MNKVVQTAKNAVNCSYHTTIQMHNFRANYEKILEVLKGLELRERIFYLKYENPG